MLKESVRRPARRSHSGLAFKDTSKYQMMGIDLSHQIANVVGRILNLIPITLQLDNARNKIARQLSNTDATSNGTKNFCHDVMQF